MWIISGRDQEFLDEQLGHIPGLGLSAEHGCFMRKPLQDDPLDQSYRNMDMNWQEDVLDIFEYYTERTIGKPLSSDCPMNGRVQG